MAASDRLDLIVVHRAQSMSWLCCTFPVDVTCLYLLAIRCLLFVIDCRAPLLEECPQHHGHKGDPGVTPGTCGAIGERAQVILVWVRAPGRWERLPPTETRSHEG